MCNLTVTTPGTYTAVWGPGYKIQVSVSPANSGFISAPYSLAVGTYAQVQAGPAPGYSFSGWSIVSASGQGCVLPAGVSVQGAVQNPFAPQCPADVLENPLSITSSQAGSTVYVVANFTAGVPSVSISEGKSHQTGGNAGAAADAGNQGGAGSGVYSFDQEGVQFNVTNNGGLALTSFQITGASGGFVLDPITADAASLPSAPVSLNIGQTVTLPEMDFSWDPLQVSTTFTINYTYSYCAPGSNPCSTVTKTGSTKLSMWRGL